MICIRPIFVEARDGRVPVPCGQCAPCKQKRINQWCFRLQQEDKHSGSSYCATLTYDTRHVPISPFGRMTVRKKDVQDFLKRLRYHEKGNKFIKYYAAAEYGTLNWRPHYHIILYNVQDQRNIEKAWTVDGDLIGNVLVDNVSGAAIRYTVKYLSKPRRIPQYRGDDRAPEFQLTSKGLGAAYLNDNSVAYHRADLQRNYVNAEGGFKTAMPRYYRDRIWTEDQKAKQRVIIQTLVDQADADNYASFLARYGPDADYEYFLTVQKEGIENAFHKNTKPRNL